MTEKSDWFGRWLRNAIKYGAVHLCILVATLIVYELFKRVRGVSR